MVAIPLDTDIQHTIHEWLEGLRIHLGRKLASSEDAEDLAQETCYKLLRGLVKKNEIKNPGA